MNRWRIAGLVLAAVLAAWLTLRSCAPQKSTDVPQSTTPVRDQFHASRPLRVVVTHGQDNVSKQPSDDLTWLERELRYLLIRGRMQVAAVEPGTRATFTLKVELVHARAKLSLIAPDGVVDRELQVELGASALSSMQSLASALPSFLGAAHTSGDWGALLGTADSNAYDNFLRSSNELLGATGHGFTQPVVADSSATVDRLETLTKKQPRFARAWSLLSIAYLGLGGKDAESLTQLAKSTAEHALALDPALTDAQSALGLVRLRRGEWAAALESFQAALQNDANASAALEGLACLLMDVGHAQAALPVAQRAVALQPGSVGANECLVYAQLATGTAGQRDAVNQGSKAEPLAVAQVRALDALLAGQPAAAQRALRGAVNVRNSAAWIDPLMQAAGNRRRTSQALQAITRAASDRAIDPVTEVVCGAALKQSDFVFNRMLRLHEQNEAVPLRILWLPATGFLRKHPRFEEIISAEGLLPFWQDHGPPDICTSEPAVFGCKVRPQKKIE